MTPQTPVQNPTPARRRVLVLGAVLVAATLVGTGAFMAIPDPRDAPGNEGLSQDHTLATPDAVLAEAQRVLPALAAGDPTAATDAADEARAALDAAAKDAQEAILAQAAAQQAALAAAVDATGDLPNAPRAYVPGADVTRFVGPVQSAPYAVPTIRVPTAVGTSTLVDATSVGGGFATGSGAPSTGVAELDGLTQQVGVLDGAFGGLGGQDLGAVLGGLGVPLPAGLDGSLPTSSADPAGTVSPDEEGARNALLFGYEVTDGVTGALGGLDGRADAVLAAHAGLIDQVETLAADARALEAEAAAGIDTELQSRIAATQAVTQERIAALEEARDAYLAAVEATHADATAALDAEVATARATVQDSAKAQAQALADEAARLVADAEARSADVDAKAQAYLAMLAEMQADGDDVTAEVAAVQAEAARLRAAIQTEADAQQAALLAAAEGLPARADAHLADVDAVAAELPDLTAQVDAAADEADRLLAYGEAIALAKQAATVTAHADAAQAALADLHARSDAHVEDLRASADGFLTASEAFAATGSGLAKQVQADGEQHVNLAVEYVRKVAEDYSSLPAEEREAAAEELLAEAETLTTIGLGAVASGDAVVQDFAAIEQSSAQLREQLAVLPL